MPLIVVSGLPTSGKTTRAKQLQQYLEKRIQENNSKFRLHYISDQTLSISRTVYDLDPAAVPTHTRSANASEKDARATIYGAVKRVLSDHDIVILDGLNYIKGWRYQLHCEAKAMRTPSVVLQIGCSVDRARQVNEERLQRRTDSESVDSQDEEGYRRENWDNLVFRYEEPNAMTRWDSPLFTLIWEDDEDMTHSIFEKLWEAIAGPGRKVIRPNQATVPRTRDASGDYLYILERETQEIVRRILEQQQADGGAGDGVVRIARTAETGGDDIVIELPGRKLMLPQLQRIRRAFVTLNRGGIGLEYVGNLAVDRIREIFAVYLNDTFERED